MSNQVGLLSPQTKSEALADLARHPAVGGWKNLALYMNPKLDRDDPEAAGKWLDRALLPQKQSRDVLHDEHMNRAYRLDLQVGCHALWRWHAEEDIGYHAGDPMEKKSRRLMLLEERERLSQRDRQIQEDLDELDRIDENGLKSVS